MPDLPSLIIRGATLIEQGEPPREVEVIIDKGVVKQFRRLNWGGRAETTRTAGGRTLTPERVRVIDGTGVYLSPGFIDLHVHLREPGGERRETIASGAAAAAAGGFTTVVAMANTDPVVDNVETLKLVLDKATRAPIRVYSVAAVTPFLEGFELTDFEALADAGAIAFSDDGRNAYGPEVAEAAMAMSARVNRPVLVHAQDEAAAGKGQADPTVAKLMHVHPWPCTAEVSAVGRAIAACRKGGGHLHLQHLSCEASLELLEAARTEGLPVTAEATPHHMALTADRCFIDGEPQPMAKVNPPLRPESDRRAIVAAVQSGLIDAIATDHAPHEGKSKVGPFEHASFGISGLETALPTLMTLVDAGELTLGRMVDALTTGPWHCLSEVIPQPPPGIREGELADFILFDPRAHYPIKPNEFLSRGRNTPLAGMEMKGRVLMTMCQGRIAHSDWFAGIT